MTNDEGTEHVDLIPHASVPESDAIEPTMIPGLALEVVTLDIANPGPPVFDIEVTMPAIVRHVYVVVAQPQQSKVVSRQQKPAQGKLCPRIVYEVVPGSAKKKMRIALIMAGDSLPLDVADQVSFIGCFVHPGNALPVAVYELPFSELADAIVDPQDIAIAPQDLVIAPAE